MRSSVSHLVDNSKQKGGVLAVRVTPMHRMRVRSTNITTSDRFASSTLRHLLRVLPAVLVLIAGALLSQAVLALGILVSSTTPAWHSLALPFGEGLHGSTKNAGVIFTIACPSSTTCLSGGGTPKGAVLLDGPNPMGNTFASKLMLLGGAVVVLLIAGVMALVLWRRRVRRDAVAIRAFEHIGPICYPCQGIQVTAKKMIMIRQYA